MKCVYHAFRLWFQRGGYLFVRRSRFSRFIPHFGWCRGVIDAEHWQPKRPKRGWRVLLHKIWARGYIKKGD